MKTHDILPEIINKLELPESAKVETYNHGNYVTITTPGCDYTTIYITHGYKLRISTKHNPEYIELADPQLIPKIQKIIAQNLPN